VTAKLSKTNSLIRRLKGAGFAPDFVRTCLPDWWDEQAEASESAWLQLRLGLAERLTLDPISVMDESAPLRLSDVGRSKFKRLKLSEPQQRAVNGFAAGLARLLIAATPEGPSKPSSSATALRELLLKDPARPWIGFGDLLTACFAFGIPVAHLTTFPAGIKGMAAMTASVGERCAIFTARRPLHPAQIAFYLAHELGHIALEHVRGGDTIVEALTLDPEEPFDNSEDDPDELQADEFALELLTGTRSFNVFGPALRGTARELSRVAVETGRELRVDPGLLILCYARSSGRWPVASAALRSLPDHRVDVAKQINRALRTQIDASQISTEDSEYLHAVVAA